MKSEYSEKLTIVTNPNSTNFKHAARHAFGPLNDAGIPYDVYETKYPQYDDNVKDMIENLPHGARVISAAGDGTAEQVTAANIQGNKNQTLGFLRLGGFNDIASAHMDKDQTILDLVDEGTPVVDLNPLSYEVNERDPRLAASYITMGLTALIAAGFANPASRELLRRSPRPAQKILRLGQASFAYMRHGRKKLSDFRINGGDVIHGSTDIAIANNPIVAGMIRPEEPYFDKNYFGYGADLNMSNIVEAAKFGIPSLLGHSPLERAEGLRLDFEAIAEPLPLQAGGEFSMLEDVKSIFIYKDPANRVKVLHPKVSL